MHLQPPTTNVMEEQKGVYYFGVKIFGNLPLNIKHSSHDTNKFKLALRMFRLAEYVYSCDEYFAWNLGAIRVLIWSVTASRFFKLKNYWLWNL